MKRQIERFASVLLGSWMCAASLVGCHPPEEVGSAIVKVRAGLVEVGEVVVTVSGPGIETPITVPLERTHAGWLGTIGAIPAGYDRVFAATVRSSEGETHRGEARGVSIEPRRVASVVIVVSPSKQEPPLENVAPVIDGLAISSKSVAPGDQVALSVTFHDPNPGDELSVRWRAEAGELSDATSAMASWIAPETEGEVRLSVRVTDPHDVSASAWIQVIVSRRFHRGRARVGVVFNASPTVQRLHAEPTRIEVGETTQLEVVATDPDGDPMSYTWRADCEGSFGAPEAAATSFTLAVLPANQGCTLSVTVSDGRGGSHVGALTIAAGGVPPVNLAPVVVSTFQSVEYANSRGEVVFRVEFRDPDGDPVEVKWTSEVGKLAAPSTTDGVSRVVWTAPRCFEPGAPAIVTVSLTDEYPQRVVAAFPVLLGAPNGDCPQLHGGLAVHPVGCRLVTLTANRKGAGTWLDAEQSFSPPISFRLPEHIAVTSGGAGNGVLRIEVEDALAGTVTQCVYSGDIAHGGAGLRYVHDHCDSGALPPQTVTANRIVVHLEPGGSTEPNIEATFVVAEQEPCQGRPVATVRATDGGGKIVSLDGSDGTHLDLYGRVDSHGSTNLDFIEGVAPDGADVAVALRDGRISEVWRSDGTTLSFDWTSQTDAQVTIQVVGSSPVIVPLELPTSDDDAAASLFRGEPSGRTRFPPDELSPWRTPPIDNIASSHVKVTRCGEPVDDARVRMKIGNALRLPLRSPSGVHVGPGTYYIPIRLPANDYGERAQQSCLELAEDACVAIPLSHGRITAVCGALAARAQFRGVPYPKTFAACVAGIVAAKAGCEVGLDRPVGELVCSTVRMLVDRTVLYPLRLLPRVSVPGVAGTFEPQSGSKLVGSPDDPTPDFEVEVGQDCPGASTNIPCEYTLSSSSEAFPASGGTGSVKVTVAGACDWSAAADVRWVSARRSSGTTVTFSVAANGSPHSRTGRVRIGDAILVIQQAGGMECSFAVRVGQAFFDSTGGASYVEVTASREDCTWHAREVVTWLSAARTAHTGSGRVEFQVAENTGGFRTTELSAAGTTFNISQASAAPPPVGVGACVESVSPGSKRFEARGGEGTLTISAPSVCNWQARSDARWLRVVPGTGVGIGDSTVDYRVDKNHSPGGRWGTIAVGGQALTVQQDAPDLYCRYGLDHLENHFPAEGGSDSIKVYASFALCPFTALPHPRWIYVAGRADGVGQGTIRYGVAPNPTVEPRDGVINFPNGVSFKITQDGRGKCTYTLSPAQVEIDPRGGITTITVDPSRADCQWRATSSTPDWLTVTSREFGVGPGAVVLEAKASILASRHGEIVVESHDEASNPARLPVSQGGSCGNGTCEPSFGENCELCPTDCFCGPTCGDGTCNGAESCETCVADCGACGPVCGDRVCNGIESCETCVQDCGFCGPTCGDGVCNCAESCETCVQDCGHCGPYCGDGSCNGRETCEPVATQCIADCGDCGVRCGDGRCTGSESCETCSTDCGACGPVCGNGTCEAGESCETCTSDCGHCGPYCGDGTCNNRETCEICPRCNTCPADCGICP